MINSYFKKRDGACSRLRTDRDKLVNLKKDILSLLVLFVLPLLFLHKGIFSGSEVISASNTDIKTGFYFFRFFGFNSLRESILPLWNPYVFGGMPFIATLHTSVFYPFNLIFLILSTSIAINCSISLHLFLSGVFTYYLLKNYNISRYGATAAGIIYTFSAPQIMHIYAGHLNVLTAMVWTPLMFLFLDRFVRGAGIKYAVFLSITIAFQLLAGQPQYLFYSMIALSFYLLFLLIRLRIDGTTRVIVGRKALAYAAIVILGLALSAAQLLPTVEFTRYSTREALTFKWVSMFSFPPENLITFLIPDFFGDMINIAYWGKNYLWEMTVYAGILPLLLSIISICYVRKKIVYFFFGLAVCSLVLAIGKYTPLLKLLYTYVPGFNLFRGNSKFIFLNSLSLAVLSGFGADALVKGFKRLNSRHFRAGIIGLNLIIVTIAVLMIVKYDWAWFKGAITGQAYSGDFYTNPKIVTRAGFEVFATEAFRKSIFRFMAFLISGSALLLLYSYGKLGKKSFTAFLFALIIFDLFSFGMRYMVTFNSNEVYWDKEIVNYLRKDKEPFRVIAPGMGINTGITSGIETLGGYDTMMIKRYSEFINYSQGIDPDRQNLLVNITRVTGLTDMLNAKYIVLPPSIKVNNPSFKLLFGNDGYNIYLNNNALPRAFIVHSVRVINGRDAIFKEMSGAEFNPMKYAIFEEEPENGHLLSDKPATKNEKLKFVHYSPNKIIMEADNPQSGLLLLSNVYYPGWKAYVDGKETKIYRANYIMQAIELPAGGHTVVFHYKPFSFKLGAVISLTAVILVILWLYRFSINKGDREMSEMRR